MEQLPRHRQQLYVTYGPNGTTPLIPDAQPAGAAINLGNIDASGATGFVQIINPNAYAVDVSNYQLQGPVTAKLRPGLLLVLRGCAAEQSTAVAAGSNGARVLLRACSCGPQMMSAVWEYVVPNDV